MDFSKIEDIDKLEVTKNDILVINTGNIPIAKQMTLANELKRELDNRLGFTPLLYLSRINDSVKAVKLTDDKNEIVLKFDGQGATDANMGRLNVLTHGAYDLIKNINCNAVIIKDINDCVLKVVTPSDVGYMEYCGHYVKPLDETNG